MIAAPLAPSPASPEAAVARPDRFTLDGDEALETNLATTAARVVSGVRGLIPARKIEAILLGGGYGRGEGGVLREPAGDRPYNDWECYVFLKGGRHANEWRYGRRLAVLAQILTPQADVEVELKIASLAEWRGRAPSMFSYDLAAGHRSLAGASPDLGAQHSRSAGLPAEEATRLLMNRGTGLLLARAELERPELTPGGADFARRNLAKAQLACGDAVLAARGLYHWSCRERQRRLVRLAAGIPLPGGAGLVAHHAAGVAFKLHPSTGGLPREELVTLQQQVGGLMEECWLDLEGRRLGRPFATARAYAEDPGDKCPDSSAGRNLVLNLRLARGRPGALHQPARHPRGRIYRVLPLLLWEPEAESEPALRKILARELGTEAESSAGWIAAYRKIWARVQ